MNEGIEVTQKSAIGSQTTQIAVQNNNIGLSVSDATQMAFIIFQEYYPKLREEALTELREMVEHELQKLQSNIIPPKPKIAVPVLQNASITDEEDVRRIYAKLLASSMAESTAMDVHPAFVNIVNQLNNYDAKVLAQIAKINNTIPAATVHFTFGTKYLTDVLPHYFSPYLYDQLDVWATSVSLENLSRLKIISINEGNVTSYDYEQINNHEYIQDRFKFAKTKNVDRNLKLERSDLFIRVNDFGSKFLNICFPT